MVVRRKRGCHSGASPSLVACYFLNIILGCLGHPQAQPFANPYSFIHRKITQNLKTSSTQNSNNTFVRSVRIRNQTTTISTVANLFLFCFCIISTVLQLFYRKTHQIKPQNHKNKHTTQRKPNLSKTEQSVAIWIFRIIL